MSRIQMKSTKIPARHTDSQSDPEGHKRPGRDALGRRSPAYEREPEFRECGPVDPNYDADAMQAVRDGAAPKKPVLSGKSKDLPKGPTR
jgi:hypothetical protein